MVDIKKCNLDFRYERSIESMGTGLILFKIRVKEKNIGHNYHLFYENGKKPPLDVAINPKKGTIEYISFFLQDEKLDLNEMNLDLSLGENNIIITDSKLSENSSDISMHKEFSTFLSGNSIIIVEQSVEGNLMGYKLNEFNYILFNKDQEVAGVLLKNITSDEMEQIKESKAI
ncbi:hypothetical protein HCB49_10660 [Listeria sp. FSL L7-0123]|uniref:Uncharacterized protein n=1 Tax=Listeria cossartiae subsp. cayugensis TaxID=2713505 RepID=A0A7X0ZDG3_9LIST|nr:hypothetical protein [Listeria cossartiae]MBC2250449.1 hypothetical protein [Listeria cossartiae subsp. cayugensis]